MARPFEGRKMRSKSFRVAIIGHTGQGNYGHSLDMAFVGVAGAEIVALADPDEEGHKAAVQRTGAQRGYAEYGEMLEKEQPDIAVIATHDLRDRVELALAAAGSGAHIYLEKPVAASPEEVDQMMAACERSGSLLVVAHPWRGHPPVQRVALPLIREGKIGEPRLARMYGRGGASGGDRLFLDLCPHFFDFLWQLFGAPHWCHAHVTQDGRSVTPTDLQPGGEGMGLVAGNGIKAYYAFKGGIAAEFESFSWYPPRTAQGDGIESPYRIDIHGTAGTISLPGPMGNVPDIYFHPHTAPRLYNDDRWEVIPSEPPPDEHKWVNAHHRMARSMMDMLEGNTPEYELVQGPNARLYLEMAMAAHASHIAGARVSLPLSEGKNPFDSWTS